MLILPIRDPRAVMADLCARQAAFVARTGVAPNVVRLTAYDALSLRRYASESTGLEAPAEGIRSINGLRVLVDEGAREMSVERWDGVK